MKARFGLLSLGRQLEGSARFTMGASIAPVRMAVLVTAPLLCMKTAKAVSCWGWRKDYGDGNQVLQNFMRWPASQALYKVWVKTLTVQFWSDGPTESNDWLTRKPRPIHSRIWLGSSGLTRCSVIAKAVCGSELPGAW